MIGCRAIACSPGVSDLSSQRLTDRSEWDRVNAKIAQGWQSLGFRLYRDNVYLLSPASEDLEEQRSALRGVSRNLVGPGGAGPHERRRRCGRRVLHGRRQPRRRVGAWLGPGSAFGGGAILSGSRPILSGWTQAGTVSSWV